jgi:predicted PurR-regulated permease PerM
MNSDPANPKATEPTAAKVAAAAESVLSGTKTLTFSARMSYIIMTLLFVLIGWLHVGTLLLTVLFGYFALRLFSLDRSKTLGVVIYLVAVVSIGYGLVYFSKRAYKTLPEIAEKTIPAVVNYAEHNKIELPFTDYASFKALALQEVKDGLNNVGRYAREATLQIAMLIIGLVAALSFFMNEKWDVENDPDAIKDNIYSTVVRELIVRFETFYSSFARVIGAQIIISAINTGLTAIFLIWNRFDYAMVIIVLTFMCGLLPIIGNLISNSVIVIISLSYSLPIAGGSLLFLIVVHKLEYFINARIVGSRINAAAWELLLAMLVMEAAFGLPGVIAAPVFYAYAKAELVARKLV